MTLDKYVKVILHLTRDSFIQNCPLTEIKRDRLTEKCTMDKNTPFLNE